MKNKEKYISFAEIQVKGKQKLFKNCFQCLVLDRFEKLNFCL